MNIKYKIYMYIHLQVKMRINEFINHKTVPRNLLDLVAIAEMDRVHVAFGDDEEHRSRAASRRVCGAKRDASDGTRTVENTRGFAMSIPQSIINSY